MDLGPVEYLIITFPGDRFHDDIAPEIAKLVDQGTIRILDLVFIKKGSDSTVTRFEFSELEEGARFVEIDGEAEGFLSEDDIMFAGEALEPNSSALFVLWEDRWATDLARAMWNAGGELVIGERIPRAVVQAAAEAVEQDRGATA